jgi:hypothetical protein
MKAGIGVLPRRSRAILVSHFTADQHKAKGLVELAGALIALIFIRDDSMEQRKR